jgi:poly(3-hydroxybutyrate) depolymerase
MFLFTFNAVRQRRLFLPGYCHTVIYLQKAFHQFITWVRGIEHGIPLLLITMILRSLCVLAACIACVAAQTGLPQLNIDKSSITVSGISAGAYFASQMHYAFSSLVKGSGVIAGGPFYCAQNMVAAALTNCMSDPILINVDELIDAARGFEKSGAIDPLEGMQDAPVFIYSGTKDSVVYTDVVRKAETMYRHFGAAITSEYSIPAEHSQPTVSYGNDCGYLGEPFISKCNYDAAGTVLQVLYGSLVKPSSSPDPSEVQTFSQEKYLPPGKRPSEISLADQGYLYVPPQCSNQSKTCRLHVAFHGCLMNSNEYSQHGGYNSWALANDIVMLYPMAAKNILMNPKGCFNWWGYGGDDAYATKNGDQMQTVRNMIREIAQV